MTRKELIEQIGAAVSKHLGFQTNFAGINSYPKAKLEVIAQRAQQLNALNDQAQAIRQGALGSLDEQNMLALGMGLQCEFTPAFEQYIQIRHEATELWHNLCQ